MIGRLLKRLRPAPAPVPERSVEDLLAEARQLAAIGEHEAALAIWGPLAHKGVARAANNIGACFLEGVGVERDSKLARRWLQAAAEGGDPAGQRNFATALFKGVGGEEDPKGAFHWYEKAAQADDAEAQDMLSWMLLESEIVPADAAAARAWAEKAAAAGIGASMTRLGSIYNNALGVARDLSAAAAWWHRAVEAGDADGAAMLGAAYHLGQGVEQDGMRALLYLMLARRFGSILAETYIPAVEDALESDAQAHVAEHVATIAAGPPWAKD